MPPLRGSSRKAIDDLVYEVNLSDYAKAKEHIERILAQGAVPTIYYNYVTPAESARRRGRRMKNDGRPVKITRSVAQHIDLPNTIERLAKECGDRGQQWH